MQMHYFSPGMIGTSGDSPLLPHQLSSTLHLVPTQCNLMRLNAGSLMRSSDRALVMDLKVKMTTLGLTEENRNVPPLLRVSEDEQWHFS